MSETVEEAFYLAASSAKQMKRHPFSRREQTSQVKRSERLHKQNEMECLHKQGCRECEDVKKRLRLLSEELLQWPRRGKLQKSVK